MRYFQLPLDLPHAGRVSARLYRLLQRRVDLDDLRQRLALGRCEQLVLVLAAYALSNENPRDTEGEQKSAQAADIARKLVEELVEAGLTGDRIGQHIRNIFECLELGREGAELSLTAGENPDSLQRP